MTKTPSGPVPAPPPPKPKPVASKAPAPPPPAIPPQDKKSSPRATLPQAVAPSFGVSDPVACGDRVVLYGTGKIGKTTLAAWMPKAAFFDVERSTRRMRVNVEHIHEWSALRSKLAGFASAIPETVGSLIIDSATVAQQLAAEHVIATREDEKGRPVDSIEGFGWDKGWKLVHEELLGLLADLDRIADQGVNICLVAHDVASPVPNPAGEDYTRWEPDLYPGNKRGQASIRTLLKNWADHVLYLGYDLFVTDGKGQGSGTRTIYTQELPTHIAGSRTKPGIALPFTLDDPGAIWRELGIQ